VSQFGRKVSAKGRKIFANIFIMFLVILPKVFGASLDNTLAQQLFYGDKACIYDYFRL